MAEIGIVGLGVMGANLALNIAEKGFGVAGFDRDAAKADALAAASTGPLAGRLTGHKLVAEFAAALKPPRAAILLVPAGAPVDQAADALAVAFARGDIIIDCGNSNFRDTERRQAVYAARGIDFLGVGISGGEEGARHGPSIMAGGAAAAWERVAPIFTAAAALYEGEPCAALVGPGGAGHFVKTIHNGIEYAVMQVLADAYGVIRDELGLAPPAAADIFADWHRDRLASYLVEITATVLGTLDPDAGRPLVEVIRDTAGQKGTGRWATMEAAELGVPATIIEAAVAARLVAADRPGREAAHRMIAGQELRTEGAADSAARIEDLRCAVLAATIISYAQGFAVMGAASQAWNWSLSLDTVVRIWRAGCIIRSPLLDDIAGFFAFSALSGNLMLAAPFPAVLADCVPGLRRTVALSATGGFPVPALSAALAYFDMGRAVRSTADLIQGQRDFFGAHGFERTDKPGTGFHGPWHQG